MSINTYAIKSTRLDWNEAELLLLLIFRRAENEANKLANEEAQIALPIFDAAVAC